MGVIITVADTSQLRSVRLGVVRDDGLVVYLNGIEVGRSGMDEGVVTASTNEFGFVAFVVYRGLWLQDRCGWFEGYSEDQFFTVADATLHSS